MSRPLVSCICPTRPERAGWLAKAIACFLAQTYEEKEMVIAYDQGAVPSVPPDPRIRLVQSPGGLNIGAKRNVTCAAASGEFIAHFDDDDYSAPARIELQMQQLAQTKAEVTGYSGMKFTDCARWWQFSYGRGTNALGTSLLYSRAWWQQYPFARVSQGEDSAFVARAKRERVFVAESDLNLMYATIHPQNTCRRHIRGRAWQQLPEDFIWKEAA